jgi:MFS family permease
LKLRKPFYGWIIVGVTFLIGSTGAGVFQNILSIFLKPMVAEFGWSRAMVAGSIAFGSICGGIVSPFVGPVLDRHGPKMVSFLGILVLSAGLIGMSFIGQAWQIYIFFGVGRMIAVGVLTLVVSVTVSNWFIRRRGRAMGIAWLGPRIGSALLPLFVQHVIGTQGWRTAWSALGLLVFLVSALPSLVFLRRRPEDIGLWPDGKPLTSFDDQKKVRAPGVTNAPSMSILEPEWTWTEAVRTRSFWILVLLNCILLFCGGGVNFHVYPFLTDMGVSDETAVLAVSVMALCGALGGLVWGVLTEKSSTKTLLSIEVGVGGLAFLIFFWFLRAGMIWTVGVGFIFIFVGIYGFLFGGIYPLLSILWAEFFGRASLGSIQGVVNPFRLTANATGPFFGAICFDFFGSYTFPFLTFSTLYFLSVLIGLSLKTPRSLPPHDHAAES